mmetsp:Transcript_18981/g.48941  ORF Transcript_18981/g.48941 Transcript_18981/m.48941 type:complete len:213 (-) Transcript_18981:32-670(-)
MKRTPTYSTIATLLVLVGAAACDSLPSPSARNEPNSYLLRTKFSRVWTLSPRSTSFLKPDGSLASSFWFTAKLPRFACIADSCLASQLSRESESTVEMCEPNFRCTPAQRMQMTTPWLTAAQSGAGRPQSAQLEFPSRARTLSTGPDDLPCSASWPGEEADLCTCFSSRREVHWIAQQHIVMGPSWRPIAGATSRLAQRTRRSSSLESSKQL